MVFKKIYKPLVFTAISLFLIVINSDIILSQNIGAVGQKVSAIENTEYQIQVWQVRPAYTKSAIYQVSIQHAVEGERGSFYYTAWADTNNDSKPDKEIDRSELKIAKTKGEWSTWSFNSDYKKIFIGIMQNRTDEQIFFQDGGLLKGYKGLSNTFFYSRNFSGIPDQSSGPGYTNIKISSICTIINEIGITNEEVKAIKNTEHQIQVWKLNSEYTIPGTYKIKVKHAAAGEQGSFRIVAWTDSNNDGIPDKKVIESELNIADKVGQWSSFEFNSEYENIYVGTAWEHRHDKTYYQIGGIVKGYEGLSSTVYYSRDYTGIPSEPAIQRYTNIKVDIYN